MVLFKKYVVQQNYKRFVIKKISDFGSFVSPWLTLITINMSDVSSIIFLQHFYNKSQVVSCYWFKFQTNAKITFLPQQ